MEQGCCAVIVSSVLPVGACCCCLKPGCCRHQQPVYCQKEPNAARKDTRLLEGTCFLPEWILYVAQWSQDAVVKPVYRQMLEPVCCPLGARLLPCGASELPERGRCCQKKLVVPKRGCCCQKEPVLASFSKFWFMLRKPLFEMKLFNLKPVCMLSFYAFFLFLSFFGNVVREFRT